MFRSACFWSTHKSPYRFGPWLQKSQAPKHKETFLATAEGFFFCRYTLSTHMPDELKTLEYAPPPTPIASPDAVASINAFGSLFIAIMFVAGQALLGPIAFAFGYCVCRVAGVFVSNATALKIGFFAGGTLAMGPLIFGVFIGIRSITIGWGLRVQGISMAYAGVVLNVFLLICLCYIVIYRGGL
jgi:hypothetical protein